MVTIPLEYVSQPEIEFWQKRGGEGAGSCVATHGYISQFAPDHGNGGFGIRIYDPIFRNLKL